MQIICRYEICAYLCLNIKPITITDMTITIKYSGQQKIYNNYYKPFQCISNVEMPKMYNAGYNTYRFKGVQPVFIGENMPLILKNDTPTFSFYECQIEIMRKDGTACSGEYYRVVNKITGEIEEKFMFN